MKQTNEILPKPVLAGIIFLFLSTIVFLRNPIDSPYTQHYFFLSRSFLKGKLDVTAQVKSEYSQNLTYAFDYSIYKDKYFVPMGPFPAIAGVAFLGFGEDRHLISLSGFFLIFTLFFLFKLVQHFQPRNAFLNSLLLITASPVLTCLVFKGPWYLSGLIAGGLALAFLWFFKVKHSRWASFWLIPLVLTRPTTIFYYFLPALKILKNPRKHLKNEGAVLILSLITCLILISAYNYFRFDNPLSFGYRYQRIPDAEFRDLRKFREKGPEDYFLSNALYLLINPPRPLINPALRFIFPYFELSRYGVGLIFIMPWFLPYLFYSHRWHKDWPFLITVLAILASILSFWGEGSFQIGSRYANDFLPLLIFINLRWLKKKPRFRPIFNQLLTLGFILGVYFFFLVSLGHLRRA
ncbi:MAG: hypothetical protein JW991_02795 [Candidatus Pacebacteria bacterium]|nr:hypothetical protein [Candidatus Paceibacterota bacterium]